MLSKRLFFLFFMAGAFHFLQAQHSVEIRLVDDAMTPLAGVPVSLEGQAFNTLTDAQGHAAFVNFPENAKELKFYFPGREPVNLLIPEQPRFIIQLSSDFSLRLLENK